MICGHPQAQMRSRVTQASRGAATESIARYRGSGLPAMFPDGQPASGSGSGQGEQMLSLDPINSAPADSNSSNIRNAWWQLGATFGVEISSLTNGPNNRSVRGSPRKSNWAVANSHNALIAKRIHSSRWARGLLKPPFHEVT